jgi:hypothetical protein
MEKMNFCSNCGHKADGSNFCANCGMQLKRDEHPAHSLPPSPDQTNPYVPPHISPQSNSQIFLAHLFAEKEEQHISTFGNEQYMQFLNKGKIKKAFAILSDKRLYIRGKRYEVNGKNSSNPDDRGKAVRTEKVVDLKDVKTVEIGRVGRATSFLYLYSAIIVSLLSIGASVYAPVLYEEFSNSDEAALFATISSIVVLGLFALAVLLWLSFAASRKSCISLLCDDTWIRFPLEKYVGREGYALMRHIIILQMPYREKVSLPDANYNDSIFIEDGELIIKSKNIHPKEQKEEKAVPLNDITDIEVFKRSRTGFTAVVVCLCVIFVGLAFLTNKFIFLLMAILAALVNLIIPSKSLRLKVTCNTKWFSFPIRSKREGADIMRYIVEQQAHNEHKLNASHISV